MFLGWPMNSATGGTSPLIRGTDVLQSPLVLLAAGARQRHAHKPLLCSHHGVMWALVEAIEHQPDVIAAGLKAVSVLV